MPAWLLGALGMLGVRGAGGGIVRRTARALVPAAAGGAVFSGVANLLGDGGGSFFPGLGDDEPRKRRRRRRALTASDRADIAFITGLLGPSAGKNFALTIATRT